MFRNVDNLKRVVALGVILLMLSMLAQDAGLYCHLGACGSHTVAGSAEHAACCHRHDCQAAKKQAGAPRDAAGGPRHESCPCPCPDDCWCHQPPERYELPKTMDAPMQTALQRAVAISDEVIDGMRVDERPFPPGSLPHGAGAGSAVCRCAKLCRFLI